jgi:hypothetical protein
MDDYCDCSGTSHNSRCRVSAYTKTWEWEYKANNPSVASSIPVLLGESLHCPWSGSRLWPPPSSLSNDFSGVTRSLSLTPLASTSVIWRISGSAIYWQLLPLDLPRFPISYSLSTRAYSQLLLLHLLLAPLLREDVWYVPHQNVPLFSCGYLNRAPLCLSGYLALC